MLRNEATLIFPSCYGHEKIGYTFICQFLSYLFPDLLDLDRFNYRRRQLVRIIEMIRRKIRHPLLDPKENVRSGGFIWVSRHTLRLKLC